MGLISVVIPALIKSDKHLAMSMKCIDLARNNTKIPFELIIVETGSDYLKEYADIHIFEKDITTATKSINRGFRNSDSVYTCLLTNDCFVSDRWLESLYDCFGKEDCGAATLASSQFGHHKQDKIEEGIWFSVALMKTEDAVFDTNFVNSWDDSDLLMRLYLQGKRMYRNFNCVAEHIPGQTHYADPDHKTNFIKNKELFIKKWHGVAGNMHMYKVLTEGILL